MDTVLVTGASGFIGNELLKYFKKNNYNAIGWDRTGDDDLIKSIDLDDEVTILKELEQLKPTIVVHCAGSADVAKSVKYPDVDYKGNVTLTHNLLFALHRLHLDNIRFVFLSSAGVYGNPVSLPITENMDVNPLSPYAVHKVMCEELCIYFLKNYGMDVKIARIFSAYGAGLKKQIFWDMHKKIKKTGKLEMFGTGNESRDYIHIQDVVKSLFLLATKPSMHIIYNVANGEEITIRQVTEIFAEKVGLNKDSIMFNGIVREGDPLNWKADISRMRELGYTKSIKMESGLEDYIKWASSLN